MRVNYYEVLGVERAASDTEIRERFRKLAREHHPDRFSGAEKAEAERRFQALTEAVNVLTNAASRKQHDAEISSPAAKSATDFTAVAKNYVAHGVKAYKEGNFQEAVGHFDMAVKHNPQDPKAFHYLSLAASKIPSMLRQAVQAIETAVQREPYNPLYLKEAGMLCRRAGLPAKAERYLEEALKWDRDNAEIQAALLELRQGRETKDGGKGLLDSLFKKG